jgi:hypothetical protein
MFLALILLACESQGPADQDVAGLLFTDEFYFHCGVWYPRAPVADSALFDVEFPALGPVVRPTPQQRTAVLNAGGRIVHEFQLPTIRAVLAPDAVPSLRAYFVRGVRDTTALTVSTRVIWANADTSAHDTLIHQLGGRIEQRSWIGMASNGNLDSLPVTLVHVPDAKIPVLVNSDHVLELGHLAIVACNLGTPEP